MDMFLFICMIGDYLLCEEPISVISETDWHAFWLNVLFTALITAGAVIAGMLMNNWNDKRILGNKTKFSLKNELMDIMTSLGDPLTKNSGVTFDGESFSYTPFRFETVSYQSLIHSGSLLILDGDIQVIIRDSYSLVLEHNNLLAEIEKLVPNVFLHNVFNYREYMAHIEHIQVNLTGLESEMKDLFNSLLLRL